MKKIARIVIAAVICAVVALAVALPVLADEPEASPAAPAAATAETAETAEENEDSAAGVKAVAAAVCVGLAATAGAIGMAMAISKTNDSISRQPEASSSLRTSLMLGLVFIETAIIYALIVAILIIFVL